MSAEAEAPRLRSPFDDLLGTQWVDDDPAHARVELAIRDELKQPTGLIHGGVLAALVESICSRATALARAAEEVSVVGQSQSINFLRPLSEGRIHVEASARHRGRSSWVWEAEVTDSEGRLCALAQVITAIRPRG